MITLRRFNQQAFLKILENFFRGKTSLNCHTQSLVPNNQNISSQLKVLSPFFNTLIFKESIFPLIKRVTHYI